MNEKQVRIFFIENSNDARGHVYWRGKVYTVRAKTAKVFVDGGYARYVVDMIAEQLASFGGGLLATDETDKELVGAAYRLDLPVKKAGK